MQTSASKCYKWLKKFTFTPFQGLISHKLSHFEPTTCINDSLMLIRDHWRLVWHRQLSHDHRSFQRIDREIYLLQGLNDEPAWSPMSHWQLHEIACKMNQKAAGPDSWTGSEVASLPPEAYQLFAEFCHFCEMAGKLPNSWSCASQVHIPKGQKGLREDGARDISGLRPLAIFSVWYWASSRLQCQECQSWINTWWPDAAIGGKKGMEIYHALIPLITAAASDEYLVSLDFSLAFDHCRPDLALHVLKTLKLPSFMVTMLFDQWSNQQRFISFQNFVLPEPEHVSSSLPQGDPCSLIAMVATLCPASWEIARCYPSVTQRNFVDDRYWSSRSVEDAMAVLSRWDEWTRLLGLVENSDKSQFFHARPKGRRALKEAGAPEDNITDQICILGHFFQPSQQRKLHKKGQDRIDASLSLVKRASCLPISVAHKRLVMATGPLSKIQFGWLMHVPPKNIFDKFQSAIRKALNEPRRSCIHLRDIMRGHGLHMGFRVLQTCLCAVLRYVKHYQIPSWCKNSISSSISKQMERMSWLRTATWTWRHSVTNAVISLNPRSTYFSLDADLFLHRLREGFRAHSCTCWQSSNRRDAVLCQDFPYDETRCANARKASQTTSHAFAIITGGYVSNASFHRSDDDGQRLCPQCHVISSLYHHEFWECPHIPNAATRLAIPECILQQRLGWPSHDKNSEAILAWQVSVRKHQLNLRYKPPVQNAPM